MVRQDHGRIHISRKRPHDAECIHVEGATCHVAMPQRGGMVPKLSKLLVERGEVVAFVVARRVISGKRCAAEGIAAAVKPPLIAVVEAGHARKRVLDARDKALQFCALSVLLHGDAGDLAELPCARELFDWPAEREHAALPLHIMR